MTTRMRTRGFRSNIAQMPDEEKTSWILNAITEIENLDDKLKILRRKIMKLHKENQELKHENHRLNAQVGSNAVEMHIEDDVRTEDMAMQTPPPPTPHLSPVNTDDVIKSVKRRLKMSPRSRNRRRAIKGGAKSRKIRKNKY